MICIKRVLSLEEFAASNRLALMHGSTARKVNYLAFCFVIPILSLASLPFTVWLLVDIWKRPGNHVEFFATLCGVLGISLYFVLCPVLFRYRIRKLYRQQQLDRECEIEVAENGIRSRLIGLADSHLEWAYFDSYVETRETFVLLKKLRPVFITIAKATLSDPQKVQLRELLDGRLERKQDTSR
jgi:hypothetical protein